MTAAMDPREASRTAFSRHSTFSNVPSFRGYGAETAPSELAARVVAYMKDPLIIEVGMKRQDGLPTRAPKERFAVEPLGNGEQVFLYCIDSDCLYRVDFRTLLDGVVQEGVGFRTFTCIGRLSALATPPKQNPTDWRLWNDLMDHFAVRSEEPQKVE